MSDEFIANGPAEFEMQVFVTNDETGVTGKVTVGLGILKYPTPNAVAERLNKFETEEMEGALEGFRLMTKRECWHQITLEKTGMAMAVAGGEDWDEI